MWRGAPAPPPLRLGALLVLCSLSGLAVPVGSGSAAGELSAAAWAASMPRAAGRRQRRSVRTTAGQSTAEEEVQERDKWAMLSLNSVLLSATHPPFCSVSRCLSGVPEAETRGAPLPLTAAAASLLPASRRVPGPVAGLHHTPPLLLPPATCGLPTPFSTSFPPRRSRSVMGEVALVFLGVVGGAWA